MPLSTTSMNSRVAGDRKRDRDMAGEARVASRRPRCLRSRSSRYWSAPATAAGGRNCPAPAAPADDPRMSMSGWATRIRNRTRRDAFAEIVALDARLRHAREGREFVHHALDVVDLAHDRVGALVENIAVLRDEAAVFALQPLGRKLDRRQRISDFMRDAARDVGPGGGALRGDEIGDVVERDDIALVGAASRRAGDADVEQCARGRRGSARSASGPCGSGRRAPRRRRRAISGRMSSTGLPTMARRALSGWRDQPFGGGIEHGDLALAGRRRSPRPARPTAPPR